MIVTDIPWRNKSGEIKFGWGWDPYLVENFYDIPSFLARDFDICGVFSGQGLTRVGKSSLCFQAATFCAWRIAGGEMEWEREDGTGKILSCKVTKHPIRPLNFDLSHVVFTPEELMEGVRKGKNNEVWVLDEAREGTAGIESMSHRNKELSLFLTQIAYKNDVIFIVLPDFFQLTQEIAVSRTNFLIDVYIDSNYRRGYYSFYNKLQKEKLWFFGKRLLGQSIRYGAANPSFSGRFNKWIPFSKIDYERKKALAVTKKEKTKRVAAMKDQRDAVISICLEERTLTQEKLAELMSERLGKKVTRELVKHSVADWVSFEEKKREIEQMEEQMEIQEEESEKIGDSI